MRAREALLLARDVRNPQSDCEIRSPSDVCQTRSVSAARERQPSNPLQARCPHLL